MSLKPMIVLMINRILMILIVLSYLMLLSSTFGWKDDTTAALCLELIVIQDQSKELNLDYFSIWFTPLMICMLGE